MARLEGTPCCGVNFIDEISVDSSTTVTLMDVCFKKYEGEWGEVEEQAFLIFTDNVSESIAGKNLAKFIEEHELGIIVKTRQRKNPNTGNSVKVWVWSPNERNLKAWYNNNK